MKKRVLSLALALLMALSLLPFGAGAAGAFQYDIYNGEATITGYNGEPSGKLVIPDMLGGAPVVAINPDVFIHCEKITELVLPDGLERIGMQAFFGCTFKSVVIPSSVEWIGFSAFAGSKLEEAVVRNCCALKESSVFAGCYELKKVVLQAPSGQTAASAYELPGSTFTGDMKLESLYLPDGLTKIGEAAFLACMVLKDIYFQGSRESWDRIEVDNNKDYNEDLKIATVHCDYDFDWVAPAPPAKLFRDVSNAAFYAEPVAWAVNHDPQITNGVGDGKFAPGDTCTRGQVVTFLWRAMGCPEPESTDNPFTDVKAGAFYEKAVLWAAENDVTTGTGKTTFAPNEPCTRAHVVTFLWRAHEKPEAGQNNPFTDVKAGQYYTDAVLWAVSKSITNGTSQTTFAPGDPCTRGQIVTFLYRDMK